MTSTSTDAEGDESHAAELREFEDFFEAESGTLYARLCLVTGNRAEAEEIMQEAFLKLWERWDRVGGLDNPTGYLYRTAMNVFRKRYRRAQLAIRRAVRPEAVADEFVEADIRTEGRTRDLAAATTGGARADRTPRLLVRGRRTDARDQVGLRSVARDARSGGAASRALAGGWIMTAPRELLEREARRFELRSDALGRLRRRRDRKRRNQRVEAVVVAILVILAAIAGPIWYLSRLDRSVPADYINRDNVATLRLAWKTPEEPGNPTPTANGFVLSTRQSPMSPDGVVYVYTLPCQPVDGVCEPSRTIPRGFNNNWDDPLLVTDSGWYGGTQGAIQAFSPTCETEPCGVAWTGRTPGYVDMTKHPKLTNQTEHLVPVQAFDGLVFAMAQRSGRLFAFSESCAHPYCDAVWSASGFGTPIQTGATQVALRTQDGVAVYEAACFRTRGPGACTPDWTGAVPSVANTATQSPPLIADGSVVVSGRDQLVAFASRCSGRCSPIWSAKVQGGLSFDPILDGNQVVTVEDQGARISAYDIGCTPQRGACAAAWSASDPEGVGFPPTVSDGWVFVTRSFGQSLYAFGPACQGNCSPAWTAPLDGDVVAQPTVADGVLYVGGTDSLRAFPTDCVPSGGICAPAFTWSPPYGGVHGPVTVTQGTLLVVGDHDLYALRPGGQS